MFEVEGIHVVIVKVPLTAPCCSCLVWHTRYCGDALCSCFPELCGELRGLIIGVGTEDWAPA